MRGKKRVDNQLVALLTGDELDLGFETEDVAEIRAAIAALRSVLSDLKKAMALMEQLRDLPMTMENQGEYEEKVDSLIEAFVRMEEVGKRSKVWFRPISRLVASLGTAGNQYVERRNVARLVKNLGRDIEWIRRATAEELDEFVRTGGGGGEMISVQAAREAAERAAQEAAQEAARAAGEAAKVAVEEASAEAVLATLRGCAAAVGLNAEWVGRAGKQQLRMALQLLRQGRVTLEMSAAAVETSVAAALGMSATAPA